MWNREDVLGMVTVADILQDTGIPFKRGRAACPIHGGDNSTAFSFSEDGFCCFACGAKGGKLDLIEAIRGCNRHDAWRHLYSLAGIAWDESGFAVKPFPKTGTRLTRSTVKCQPSAIREAKERLEWTELRRLGYETILRIARKRVKCGQLSLSDFYAEEQKCQYALEVLDAQVADAKYQFNSLRKNRNSPYGNVNSR